MKYLSQFVIIIGITAVAELIRFLLPFPIPASIYGLALLFLLLKTGLLKLSAVENVGNFLLDIMPLILVPTSVSFISAMETVQSMMWPVVIMGLGGTAFVMGVTGCVTQYVSRRRKGDAKKGDEKNG